MGPNYTLEPRQQIRPRSRGTRSRSLLLESFCLIHQILEPFLISVFAPHAKMPRRGDFASLTRVIEIMLYLADELIQRRESLDLPSDRKVPIQIFGWLGQQKTAAARHLEYTSLDLPASSWNPAVPDDAGVPKIQTDHGITYDLWYSLSRDCTARPTMTEACDPYPAGAQGVNPRRTVPVIRPDERNGVTTLFRSKRLLERRHKQAQFRDADKRLDNFDFQFNPKMNRNLVFELATANWVGKREDALFLGPPGSGKSHCAQAIGHAVIQQGYRVLYREAHRLLEELADATLDGKRKEFMDLLTTVPLLIIDDLGMRKLPLTAAEELLEIIMRRYERASTLLTSNRPVDDWGKLLGDSAAVTAMLDRLLHHGHVLKCGPRSWRTKTGNAGDAQ